MEKARDKEKEKEKMKAKDREAEKKKDRGKEGDREIDRARELERERGKDQERDRDKDKEREKAIDKEKRKEKDRSKKDRDRENERERDREKVTEREKDRDKVFDREKEREKLGERVKEREKVGERRKERDKEREKAVEHEKERDKEREREKERDNDREKEREREPEDEEREREQKLRLKEKERGRDKERDNDRDKDKDREERDREKEKDRNHEVEKREKEKKRSDKDKSSKPQLSAPGLEERIAQTREERLRSSAEKRSLPKKSEPENDVISWVRKSRMLEEQKKRDEKYKAARMAKILAEQDVEEEEDDDRSDLMKSGYGAKDLAGLKVRHGLDKVMEGEAVVLTLKDVNLLDGNDVSEAVDELENIEISQQLAREDAYMAAKKKPGVYEDKFNNDISGTRTILPQYDSVAKDEGVLLDETGGINEESRKKLEEVHERLEIFAARQSLLGTASIASDYFSQEDMLQFRKPKKKKKLRKTEKADLYELDAESVAAGVSSGDLGSRNDYARKVLKQQDDKAVADSKTKAYQNALRKAQNASKLLQDEGNVQGMEIDGTKDLVFIAEDEDELNRSVEQTHQAALKKQKDWGGTGTGPQMIAARLAALSQQMAKASQSSIGADTEDSRLVFTDTGEFCRSLQLDDVIIRRAGAKDAFGEEDEEALPAEIEEDILKAEGGWTEVSEVEKVNPSGQEGADEGVVVEEPIQEISVGKGLAGALSLLKERGTLKETVDWGGRNMDKKRSKLVGIVDESNNQVGQRDILLDRVDEFGRTMTPKEAFRKLSHKFHGKGPGKMKQEKRQKQWQEELRLKQMNSGDTPLMSMEKMREAQAKMHTPYIVISGHIKPGQTSDPRSGFATVEKEPIGSLTPMLGDKVGSLTPMLGDKKVEHFLGIKRKAEPGSMGPPPPKQPKLEH